MKIFNISIPRKYTQNGAEKTAWNNVGKLVHFEATVEKTEGFILELFMYPDTKFGVFPQTPKNAPLQGVAIQTTQMPTPPPNSGVMTPQEATAYQAKESDIQISDIPF